MERDPKYFLIGLSVIVLITGLACFLVWSAKIRENESTKEYVILFKEQSLAGIQQDGIVTMKGIKVGTIKDIMFQPDNVERVLVKIQIDADTPIKTNTRAIIQRNLLTGIASIDLTGTTQKAPELVKAEDQRYPVIPEGKTELAKLQKTFPEILDDLNSVLRQTSKFLSDENAATFSLLLADIQKITAELSGHSGDLGEMIESLSDIARNSSAVSKKMESGLSAIVDIAKKVAADLESAVRQLSSEIESTGQSVSEVARTLKQGKESVIGPTNKNLLED